MLLTIKNVTIHLIIYIKCISTIYYRYIVYNFILHICMKVYLLMKLIIFIINLILIFYSSIH